VDAARCLAANVAADNKSSAASATPIAEDAASFAHVCRSVFVTSKMTAVDAARCLAANVAADNKSSAASATPIAEDAASFAHVCRSVFVTFEVAVRLFKGAL
jgi:uncharacterized protein YcfJ